jgi:4-hydroxy-tetrahydrodipicolinate reductase
MTIRVGVIGAGGRMGRAVCAAVVADAELDLVAAIGSPTTGSNSSGRVVEGVPMADELDALVEARVDVAVDFTVAAASRIAVPWLAAQGIHAVVGTTGLDDDDLSRFAASFTTSNCVVASNFAISAVLMMRFAELAAPWFETAEIIELHHDAKVDAPSGTAVSTASRMARASKDWAPDPTEHEVYPGARGGIGPAGIRVHAVRMRGMVAHQEVILGTQGQTLTIRQDSYDRSSYMPGVVVACKQIANHPGLTIGLDPFLGV